MEHIKLSCHDGTALMPRNLLYQNKVISNMLDDGLDIDIIPINFDVANMVDYISFCEMRFAKGLINDPLSDNISDQENWFLKSLEASQLIFEKLDRIGCLMSISNFLDNEEVTDVCAKYIVQFTSKIDNIEHLRRILKVKNDFTQEEEEKIRNANLWCVHK